MNLGISGRLTRATIQSPLTPQWAEVKAFSLDANYEFRPHAPPQLGDFSEYVDGNGKVTTGDFDTVISAVGIVGNVENLGLEALGVKVDRTHVVVDEYCRTGVDGLYAIGDIAGPPWLAHKASHEGVMVAEMAVAESFSV